MLTSTELSKLGQQAQEDLSEREYQIWKEVFDRYGIENEFHTRDHLKQEFVDKGAMTEGALDGALQRIVKKGYLTNIGDPTAPGTTDNWKIDEDDIIDIVFTKR
ncbi:hypothetical protein [Lactiplantibacillus plantarum]|uniref:hypothetical protein n=1 Tax=Lactiplantibacillus plantarum TaxID=1590 RepID=UPI0018AD3231|nr:hypothetical protein [Lactiplantibacillus plantarum]WGF84239.1 hypothetical protein QB909_13365 [Lactiplantibacillus plantarum]WGG41564.1 hypothetical protein QCL57_13365 [Lactiplantibacillus plantarum]